MNLESVVGGVWDVISVQGAYVGVRVARGQQGVVPRRVTAVAHLVLYDQA